MKKKTLLAFLLAAGFSGILSAQNTLQVRVNQATDDMEEYVSGSGQTQTIGTMDAASSDLELGAADANNKDPQLIGIRFNSINLPQGAYIKKAYIEFTVDAINKNTNPCELIITAQDADNPLTFDPNVNFNVSSRAMLSDSIAWSVSGATWNTVGSHGEDQQTPDITALVQQLVDRSGWASGNAMAFFVKGTGLREVEAFDGSAPDAPLLVIEYGFKTTVQVRVNSASDDLEEWIAGSGQTKTVGTIDAGSSDLEFGFENTGLKDPQLTGIRFATVAVPANAEIVSAYLEFTVDATSKNQDPAVWYIKAEDNVNSVTFPGTNNCVSSRAMMSDSVTWNVAAGGTWNTVGSHGAEQQSPDLKDLVKALVDKNGWVSGNPMTFFIKGTGCREVESFDGDAPKAPLLVITYASNQCVGNATSSYPVSKGQSWNYDDNGDAVDANWKAMHYNDTCWTYGNGTLGYGVASLGKTISYGADANNKHKAYYFRKRVNVADLSVMTDTLLFNVRVNDGMILYVNGAEAIRFNMPNGVVNNTTLASSKQADIEQTLYYTFFVPKSLFQTGDNIITAEVHQHSANSADLAFDMEIVSKSNNAISTNYGCTGANDNHISCFTSVVPRAQNDTVEIPFATHAMQYIFNKGMTYTDGNGVVPGTFDFTGYVPINGSSKLGYLSVNHENTPGGVSMLEIHLNETTGLWVLDSSKAVDFGGELVQTIRNCSGTVTPWNTIITSEESTPNTDANSDGYHDVGWHIEIDPATARVKEYGNGKREKLWKMGKMNHENVVIASDKKTAYYGEDAGSGKVWKFVADVPENLYNGTLYVLKLDQPMVNGEPSGSTGTWVQIDNSTPALCNTVNASATAVSATSFSGIEDAEISPLDGKVYFTAKGLNRVYRFKDDGTTVSGFETFVGANNYLINSNGKIVSEAWGSGNDNLTFDDRGNLYVLQDGSRNHIWMVYPDHTQANPKVEVFMVTPSGSEPTGMTFSPDYKYMFLSIQSPSGSIAQKDVAGTSFTHNNDVTLVIARKQYLGVDQTVSVKTVDGNLGLEAYPNPFADVLNLNISSLNSNNASVQIIDITGKEVFVKSVSLQQGVTSLALNTSALANGVYFVKVSSNEGAVVSKVVLSK